MMGSSNEVKNILRELLDDLYQKQRSEIGRHSGTYLIACDGQFLGEITTNTLNRDSINNQYGPYGSPYSSTSIFNQYSSYGSPYGQHSVNNPYTSTPPKLFINNRFAGQVTKNQYISGAIPTEVFITTLKNNPNSLINGRIPRSGIEALAASGGSFIVGSDGTYLGKLNSDRYDSDSVLNEFGVYGSQFSPTSVFNPYSAYGSEFDNKGAANPYATKPPMVYINGQFRAYLTANGSLNPRLNPRDIRQWIEQVI